VPHPSHRHTDAAERGTNALPGARWPHLGAHGSSVCLAAAALGALALLGLAGCQTPPQSAAPVYGSTVAPPATGMIGQPAPYNGYVSAPQGAAYPPAPVMPGPSAGWQPTAPTAPTTSAAPAPNTWSWSQSGTPTAPPSLQQSSNQFANQAQQYANQMQAQPQQMANQAQQAMANQQQQWNQQLQNTTNQYQQGFNNQVQAAQQQANNQLQAAQQQVTAQMPTYQAPPPANSWNPFATSASSMPPARATPTTAIPRY